MLQISLDFHLVCGDRIELDVWQLETAKPFFSAPQRRVHAVAVGVAVHPMHAETGMRVISPTVKSY